MPQHCKRNQLSRLNKLPIYGHRITDHKLHLATGRIEQRVGHAFIANVPNRDAGPLGKPGATKMTIGPLTFIATHDRVRLCLGIINEFGEGELPTNTV